MDWKEKFKDPPKEYRGIPFWSLNDELDHDELRWQINQMKEAGLGGYFMHARSGLKTPYMSEKWLKAIEVCVHEGAKLDISPWLYDENGWPSGFADGKIPSLGVEYHQKWLQYHQIQPADLLWSDRTVGVYIMDKGYRAFRPFSGQEAVDDLGAEEFLLLVEWVNNPYYVDILNKKVIRAFIEHTHEVYYQHLGDMFGTVIPGIFTDEPQYAAGKIPWSFVLPSEFEDEHGYSIISVLPALLYKVEGYRRVRYDFWKTVNRLVSTSFSKQIGDWCRQHKIVFTGHVMAEDSLLSQVRSISGAMPFYQHMQMPGIDWLLRRIGNPIVPKQVSSIAHQLGRKRVISEMFGCSGWNISFEELKWIAEWQYVLGVNTMCQHLQWYSMKGLRKRDYPPSLFYQQPWWPDYKIFNDYFGRLSVLLTEGKPMVDVLVIHPLHSAWLEYSPVDNDAIKWLDRSIADISQWLMELHIGYDYGDESVLAQYGDVEGNSLIVDKARYSAVIIPPALTLDRSTVQLLYRFAQTGGHIISIGNFPTLVSGRDSDDLVSLKRKAVCISLNKNEIKKALGDYALEVVNDNGDDISYIYIQQREMGAGQRLLFAVNISQHESVSASVKLKGQWDASICRLETGEFEDITAKACDQCTCISLDFAPMQSYAILFKPAQAQAVFELSAQHAEAKVLFKELSPLWDIELEDYNALTLDYARVSVDGGAWSEPMPVIAIQDMLLRLGRSANVALRFDFDIEDGAFGQDGIYLGIEDACQFHIEVNGQRITYSDIGWWRDKAIKKIDISRCIRPGRNEVILRLSFRCSERAYKVLTTPGIHEAELNKITYDTEVESIYVLGHFGVYSLSEYTSGDRKAVFTNGPFVCRPLQQKVTTGDLTRQGLAFYAGKVKLMQYLDTPPLKPGQRVLLDLGLKPNDVLTKVWLNDKLMGVVPWAPYMIDITDGLKSDRNLLVIELVGSCRNLLGPHHHIEGELYGVGPSSFTAHKGWVEAYIPQDNIWVDRYCFVEFGLASQPIIKIT